MYIGKYCPDCGRGEGNQGCKIARCFLDYLLMDFNDGRKKTLFRQTVNLLDFRDLRELLSRLERCPGTTIKEKGVFAAEQVITAARTPSGIFCINEM